MVQSQRWEKLAELDGQLVQTARNIKVLSALSWPQSAANDFIEAHRRGERRLPEATSPIPTPAATVESLDDVIHRADAADPIGAYLRDTAISYRRVTDVLRFAGTEVGHRASLDVYGGPSHSVMGTSLTNADVANRLIEGTKPLAASVQHDRADYCVTAMAVERAIRQRSDQVFGEGAIQVVIDPTLSAKAAASAIRIRIRSGTCFSDEDVGQLIEHELLVHTLTAQNGRSQRKLTSLSLGAPRTTATQEGLATFAEMVTQTMDLSRLRRIAVRVRLIERAIAGADFIDLYEELLEAGEPETEAVRSAMRVFRGGDPRGRFVFTKDVVYLRGLLETHTFLTKAIADRRPELIARLFAGRMTLPDVLRLEESFADGDIEPPKFQPPWATAIRTLAAYLSFSAVAGLVDFDDVLLDQFE